MTSLYILELTNNKYYIGTTKRLLNYRVLEHFSESGSEWTRKYKPLKVLDIKDNVDQYDEDKYTKIYMNKYGIDNVRGGSYVSIVLPKYQIQSLEKELKTINNQCFTCGQPGHYSVNCPYKNIGNIIINSNNSNKKYNCDYCAARFTDRPLLEQHEIECVKSYPGDICYKCGYKGHDVTKCHAQRHKDGSSFDLNTCYRCGRKGHWRINCYEQTDIYGRPTENLCIIQ